MKLRLRAYRHRGQANLDPLMFIRVVSRVNRHILVFGYHSTALNVPSRSRAMTFDSYRDYFEGV